MVGASNKNHRFQPWPWPFETTPKFPRRCQDASLSHRFVMRAEGERFFADETRGSATGRCGATDGDVKKKQQKFDGGLMRELMVT